MSYTGASLAEAVSTVTTVPAMEMGIDDHKGRIATGYDADIVLVNENCEVAITIVKGSITYSKDRR